MDEVALDMKRVNLWWNRLVDCMEIYGIKDMTDEEVDYAIAARHRGRSPDEVAKELWKPPSYDEEIIDGRE